MAFGLTNQGFVKKDAQTIKSEIEGEFKAVFGTDIDVSESSNFGQIIGLLTKKVSNQWDLAQSVYASQSPDTAVSTQLDRVVALVGVERLEAVSTSANGTMTGDQGTVISTGSLAEKEETGDQFELLEDVTLDKAACVGVDFSVANVLDSTLYTITVDTIDYTYTSGASGTTAEDIIAGLKIDFDAGGTDITYTDNLDGTATLTADDSVTNFSFNEDVNLQTDKVSSNGSYSAVVAGEISLPAGTLNIIVTPISGWDSITNLIAGDTGREEETDEELRTRRLISLRAIGAGTDEAIAGRISEVENVTSSKVTSNRTGTTDADGRPAKSFEAVVEGGADQDIGDVIWDSQPAGIESFGNTTVIVKDSQDNDQTIKFSRPESIFVWYEIDLTLYDEETFPTNGTEAVKDAIIDFGEEEYQVDVDVIRERVYQPIFSVEGIRSAVIKLATSATEVGPPGTYQEVDIEIGAREIASIAKDRMIVGIV